MTSNNQDYTQTLGKIDPIYSIIHFIFKNIDKGID